MDDLEQPEGVAPKTRRKHIFKEHWDYDVDPPQRKPLLRGWSHAVAALIAVIGVIVLIAETHSAMKRIPIIVYGVTLILLLTISATYHIGQWQAKARHVLQQLDHSNIFLFIAGTYTPVAVILLHGNLRIAVVVGAWALAAAGIATTQLSIRAPRWVAALIYLGMGWGAIVMLPQLLAVAGAALVFVAIGGVLYSLGAVAYATKRPRLWPKVFGYHEVFHLAVIGASAMFYTFMAVAVIPHG